MAFWAVYGCNTKHLKTRCFFDENSYKIAMNCPIFKKLTVPSRQEFAIFKKKPDFLNLGKSEGRNWAFFGLCYPHIKL